MQIEFIEYNDSFKKDVKRLTVEWLEKYDVIEQEDTLFMDNPAAYVTANGGMILLAKINEAIIGTVSAYKLTADTYEIIKLAVTEKCKGLHIGRQLMLQIINKCVAKGATKIILYTAKKLEAALHLYTSLGFMKVENEGGKYKGADTKMELLLG
jgi:ribosomal protein S18 acetylase RimI-like enzyme